MNLQIKILFGSIAVVSCVTSGNADSVMGRVNTEWVIASPIFVPFALPAVQSIDSVEIQIAHTNGHDLLIYLDAADVKGEMDFELIFQETAEPPPGDNYSLGIAPEDGTLANVATYTFVPKRGGGFVAPHTPATTINANTWMNTPLPAQDYLFVVGDLEFIFDGGAIGTFTINYTPAASTPGDVNGDSLVNVDDLLAVIEGWGPCPPPPKACPADLDASGIVNVDDLLTVIVNWG